MKNEITLADVTRENWRELCALNPGEEGLKYTGSNSWNLLWSHYEPQWIVKGIALDGQLIGCARFGPSLELPGIELIHFMIDERFQGRGFGRAALCAVAAEMFRRFGVAEIYLSVDPENARAKHVYEAVGFFATGEKDKHEDVFCLKRETFLALRGEAGRA